MSIRARTVVSYGRGRYGVDIPLPAPGAPKIVLQPVVPHPTPQPAVARRPRPVWTQEQIDLLEEMVRAGAGIRECSDALGRTVGAVHRRIADLGSRPAAAARPVRGSAQVEPTATVRKPARAPAAPAAARPNGWRASEDQTLRDMTAAGERAAVIAARLGRSYSAVVKRKASLGVVTPRLGLVRPDQWTDAEIERVATMAAEGHSTAAIAVALGRTESATAHVKWRHGIRSKKQPSTRPVLLPSERAVNARPTSRRASGLPERILATLAAASGRFGHRPDGILRGGVRRQRGRARRRGAGSGRRIPRGSTRMTTIATRIVTARTARGLASGELASAAGIVPAQLSRYESGVTTPSVPTLVRIAAALGVSLDYLAGATDDMAAAGPETQALVRELGRLRITETAIVADLVAIMNTRRVTP